MHAPAAADAPRTPPPLPSPPTAGAIPGHSPYAASDALLCCSAPDFLAPSCLDSLRAQKYLQTQRVTEQPDSVDKDASTVTIPEFDISLPIIMPRSAKLPPVTSSQKARGAQDVLCALDNVFVPSEHNDEFHMARPATNGDTIPALKGAVPEPTLQLRPGPVLSSTLRHSSLQQSPEGASLRGLHGGNSGGNSVGAASGKRAGACLSAPFYSIFTLLESNKHSSHDRTRSYSTPGAYLRLVQERNQSRFVMF